MLDEKHDWPRDYRKHPRDTNQYFLGRIGQHNVVITALPMGEYGCVPAATTAWGLIASFPHIRVGLMVGIGAGVPKVKNNKVVEGYDIRLGDVVVSEPNATNSGVLQYDLGKRRPGGQFERVGFMDLPPEPLLIALRNLKARYHNQPPDVPKFLQDMLRKNPRLAIPDPDTGDPAFVHQGVRNDRLFDTSASHVASSDDEDKCAKCDHYREICRNPRSSTNPVIHYGTIASGNSVVKDAISRKEIQTSLSQDCLCLEMEAAGLMNFFPCLVVRGICDYADAHKNDRWQNYAAATAAAFAKSLLYVLDARDFGPLYR
ncbi:nucleoside phosphorylase domain-containing protein [Macrophomina phaseolina]|uniref:Nucleoside phosphorylase domain-containing protein n=1 Tax=Macrophomina phaseolina TaxID=35725 RepID=A0ABQ8GI72_9PEZI|nr:nucleoside phosphorylase domain-containing protein [Macrophomina phaseolina]